MWAHLRCLWLQVNSVKSVVNFMKSLLWMRSHGYQRCATLVDSLSPLYYLVLRLMLSQVRVKYVTMWQPLDLAWGMAAGSKWLVHLTQAQLVGAAEQLLSWRLTQREKPTASSQPQHQTTGDSQNRLAAQYASSGPLEIL